MSLFEKLNEIFFKKKEKEGITSDINKGVSDIHEDNQNIQYVTKNAKFLDLSHDEKSECISSLSARERETFLLLLEGFTLKECSNQMGVKYPTANTYMTAVYKKLKVNTSAELIINYHEKKNNE